MTFRLLQIALALPFSWRQKALSRKRPPTVQFHFVKLITAEGGDEEAAVLIWKKLLDWIYVAGFTPYPHDDLGKIYGIAEEELDEDLIADIFLRLDILLPDPQAIGSFGALSTPLQISQMVKTLRCPPA